MPSRSAMQLLLHLACAATLLAAIACGGDEAGASDTGGGAKTDTGSTVDTGGGDGSGDIIPFDGGQDTGDDASGDTGAADGEDTSEPPKPCAEPNAWGCSCKGNADCNSGWCIDTAEGKVCTTQCVESCPSDDWKCVQAPGTTDLTYVCAPKHTTFCQPCAIDSDCEHMGQAKGATRCLVSGKDGIIQGSFCSSACAEDIDCPAGSACVDAATCKASGACSNVAEGKFCLPKDKAACACSAVSKATSAATACSVTTSAGTCQGTRACGAEGLSACSAKTPAVEQCNSQDDDCDGESDEGFVYDDVGSPKALGKICGVGACVGGEVQCSSDGAGVVCTTGAKAKSEICDYVDNDCDGQTDEALTVADSPCLQKGVCTTKNVVATCDVGKWSCSYLAVDGYHKDKELTCDGLDNDCDGEADEEFTYLPQGATVALAVGEPCDGVGACGAGVVECGSDGKGAVCSTDAVGSASAATVETCDGQDNDCDGETDEGCDDDKDGFCDAKMGHDPAGATCAKGSGDCNDVVADIAPGVTETCDNIDNDCDAATDEGCDDDKDGFCDDGMVVVGMPAACTAGGGDCDDVAAAIHPAAQESCNTIDDDCDTKIDAADPDLSKVAPLCENQQGVCAGAAKPSALCAQGQWGACSDQVYASHNGAFANVADEATCDDLDNDCSGSTDDNCDKDQDNYCDAAKKTVGKPAVCAKGGGDCNDNSQAFSPGTTEVCDGKLDENCNGQTDEENADGCGNFYPDLDGDGSGDKFGQARCLCGPEGATKYTAKVADDCNDKNDKVHPKTPEDCTTNDDDDCNGATNDVGATNCTPFYQDGDNDGFGDKGVPPVCMCVAKAGDKLTATKGGDCDDAKSAVNPDKVENCLTPDDDDCSGTKNDINAIGCSQWYPDGDKDGYGQKDAVPTCLCVAEAGLSLTAKTSNDCNDGDPGIKPGITDTCATKNVDDNCDGSVDPDDAQGCKSYYLDVDGDGYGVDVSRCMCAPDAGKKYTSPQIGDCNDGDPKIKPGAPEICDGINNDCDANNLVDNGAAAQCQVVPHANLACVSGQCKVGSCEGKWYDINGSYGDGCECGAGSDFGLGGSAGAAIDLGTFADNKSSKTYTGRFSPGETGRWFRFKATDGADAGDCDTFNVQAALVNSHANYIFDVYRNGASSGNLLCSNETVHEWKVDFYSSSPASGPGALPGGSWGANSPSPGTKPSGECKCSTSTSSYSGGRSMPGMNFCVNNSADFYVYVKLKAGAAPFCGDYNLYVRNGVK